MNRLLSVGVVALTASLSTSIAHATILTFDGVPSHLLQAYGDNVVAEVDPITGYRYGRGNGFTPNVTVEYVSANGGLEIYSSGYAPLFNALGDTQYDVAGSVILTAEPGYLVRLNSFRVAPWTNGQGTSLEVVVGNTQLISTNLPPVRGQAELFVLGDLAIAGSVRIGMSRFGDWAIDDIDFDQVLIPSPAGIAPLALASVALFRRRR